MPSLQSCFRRSLVVGLAVVAIGSSFIAWWEYRTLTSLRLREDEAAQSDRRARDLEKRNRELEAQIAARRPRGEDDAAGSGNRDRLAGDSGRNNRLRGDRTDGKDGDPVRALLESPEMQALRAMRERGALDNRYAALFKSLKLPAAQLEKLKNLLIERQTTLMDTMAIARDEGVDPRSDPDAFRQLLATTQSDIDRNIKSLLGDPAYSEYQTYEQTAAVRNVVNQLEQRLSYTDQALTPAQSEQLVALLATTPSNSTADLPRPPGPGGPGGNTATITPTMIAQAQSILNASQTAALQSLQQQQQAQQQFDQAMRNAFPNGPGGPPAARGGG